MMAIQHTDFTIHGSNIMVLGLGRVGMSVARTFQHLVQMLRLELEKVNILQELRKWA